MRRLIIDTFVIGVCLLALPACSGKHTSGGFSGVSRAEADAMNAEHSRFEGSRDPQFMAATHFAAGQLAESQGSAAGAVRQYRRALAIDGRHTGSLFRLGVLYAQGGAYADAIETWKRYLAETGEDAGGWGNLGYCHELAGDVAQAEAAYRQGISRDGAHQSCRVNYGLMLARLGRVEEAVAQLGAVLPPARVHYNLASVYEQQGRLDEARTAYLKALELDAGLMEARERLAGLE